MNSWLNETPGLFEQHRSNALEMHPDDAAALDLQDGQWARVSSATGSVELPIVIVAGGRPGVVAIPHGWGSRIFDPKSGTQQRKLGVNRNLLVDRREVDPFSQIPALTATPVRAAVRLPAPARQERTRVGVGKDES